MTSETSEVAWAASADGSTLVSVERHCGADGPQGGVRQPMVIVRDATSGRERSRFQPPVRLVCTPILSPDGTKLVLNAVDLELKWYVLDTTSGELLATISTNDRALFGGGTFLPEFWIDPSGLYLEGLVCTCAERATGPEPAQLVRYDLATGQEAGRLTLPVVMAGTWQVDDAETPTGEMAHLTPGTAVSPDGRLLAVVHADAEAVTLVDLARFAVDRTIELTRPAGVLDRLIGLLPLAPQAAEAKSVPEGTLRAAAFHPDGRHLYVHGFENWMKSRGGEDRRGLGLLLVDLETGEIVAETADDASFGVVLPAPDGAGVYVVGGTPSEASDGGTLLRRLDAMSLEPVAERRFSDWHEVMLLPIEPRSE
jgi:hypothetical protein